MATETGEAGFLCIHVVHVEPWRLYFLMYPGGSPPTLPPVPNLKISGGGTPRIPLLSMADTIEFQWVNVNHGNSDFVVYKWKYRNSDFVVYKWKRSKYPTLKCHISKS